MKKLVKRVIALSLAAMLTASIFVGCGKNETIDNNEVVSKVGETEITLGIANFYARYSQSLMESLYASYLGENFWAQEASGGATYEDNLKDTIMENLQDLYILKNHMGDYKVTITDEEQKAMEAAADTFLKKNSKEAKEKISATKEIVVEYLTLLTIEKKMEDAIKDDIDKEVKDEDAAQKKMIYVEYATTKEGDDGESKSLSDEEVAELKSQAEAFLAGVKKSGNMEEYAKTVDKKTETLTFDKDSTSLGEEVIKAADALKEKEISEIIETEDGFYILQLESTFDRDATDKKKEEIIEKRGTDKYKEVTEKWQKDTKKTLNKKVWKKVSLQGLKITPITEEKDK